MGTRFLTSKTEGREDAVFETGAPRVIRRAWSWWMKEHFLVGSWVGAQGSWSKKKPRTYSSPFFFFFLIWRIPQEPREERCSVGFSFFYLKWHSIRDGSLRESILSCLEFIKCFNKKEQVKVTWTVSAPWKHLVPPTALWGHLVQGKRWGLSGDLEYIFKIFNSFSLPASKWNPI